METLANIMLFACIAILAMQFAYDARYEIRARIKAELRARTRAKKLRMLQQRNI
jgi:hypothetical protein